MAIPRPRSHLSNALDPCYLSRAKEIKDAFKVYQPRIPVYLSRAKDTQAVSWHTENQIVNSSYHKNSPDPVEGYWITHNIGSF
jgi:hypothetical protein